MVSTSCFVLAGTPPKLRAGLTPPPCASQVYFDGIFSPCLNAGDVSSSASAVCAMSSPPAMNAMVTDLCRCVDLPCRGLITRDNRPSYDRRWIASNARRAPVPLGRLLERMRECKHLRFAEVPSADLETDGEARAAEAARDGDGRQAVDVEWLRVAQRRCNSSRRRHCWIDGRLFNLLRQDRRRRCDEQIDVQENGGNRAAQTIEFSPPFDVGGGRDAGATFESLPCEGLVQLRCLRE